MFRPVRTRLLEELELGLAERPKVLSIVAPMGYGKTVLMSELYISIQRSGELCYWVGLSDRDTSLERVLNSVETVLFGPETSEHPTQALFRGDDPIESRVAQLVESIAGHPDNFTLFIDNLNSCLDESLGIFLDALIFRTSSSVRFVWSSTTVPTFNAGRAKLEGLIHQVGFSELKFNEYEATALFGQKLASNLGASGIETVLRRTEGWPGAIRMAQIILSDSAQPLRELASLSGSDEDISALLNRQVLKAFTSELRRFLLRIGQLQYFTADMCAYVTEDNRSRQHIELLVRRNVFIIPLDRNREAYRFHGLFHEFLIAEAAQTIDAEERRNLLRRAAIWCEQNGKWHDAMDYALKSGEFSQASRILDRTATIFVRDRGDMQQYIHWIKCVEAEGIELGWEAQFWYVWALTFHRRYVAASLEHDKLAKRQTSSAASGGIQPAGLQHRVDLLRICIDLLTDKLADVHAGAEQWLNEKPIYDPFDTGSVYAAKTLSLIGYHKFSQARQSLRISEQMLSEVGGAAVIGWTHLMSGMLSVCEGHYAHAYKELLAGLSRMRAALGEDSILSDTIATVAAKCAIEMGMVEEARRLLNQGLRSAHHHGLVDTMACGLDTAIALWNGEENDAISIPYLREIAGSYPPRLSLMLSCYLIRHLLNLGRLDDALLEAERIDLVAANVDQYEKIATELEIPRYRDLYAATLIELRLASGQLGETASLIDKEYHLAQSEGRVARTVELGLAKAVVALKNANPTLAGQELMLAVSRAARQRIVRPFLDRTGVISSLVSDTKPSLWSFPQREEQGFFAEICRSLPISNRLLHDWSEIWASAQITLDAPTKRESELLSMLDMGLSNQQIADYSNVSIATIKWHLQNLYRKFGVSNRSAALARARALNLLSK